MKAYLIIPLFFAIGIALSFAFPNFNIINQIQNVPATLQNVWSWLQSYGVTPAQLIGAVGGLATISTIIISKLRAKITETKQQAEMQVYQTQAYASQQQKTLLQQITDYKSQLTAKDMEIQKLQSQLANAPDQQAFLNLKANYEKLQNDYNAMEKFYQDEIDRQKLKIHELTVYK